MTPTEVTEREQQKIETTMGEIQRLSTISSEVSTAQAKTQARLKELKKELSKLKFLPQYFL